MRVFIIRHGETDWNVQNRCQGVSDTTLNTNGLEQAQAIANRLRLEHFDAIISSPLKRALITAQQIAKYHIHIPFLIEENLREIAFGEWEGLTWKEVEQKYGPLQKLTPHEEFVSCSHGGDSLEQRVESLIPVVTAWKQKYKNKCILLSTHGYIKKGILIAFEVVTNDENLQNQRFGNTALTIIRPFDDEKIELLGDTSHLGN